MGNRIDVRALKLNKLYVPKTFDAEKHKYIAVGYFDFVELRGEVVDAEEENPFNSAYKIMMGWKNEEKKGMMDYSSQEQMLFTDICGEGEEEDGTRFSEETIRSFWGDAGSPYLFMSMVHINHTGNLELALKEIKEKFGKDYLSYVSFDYCDIIIFAKKLKAKGFLDKIKSLFVLREKNERVIVDTFSMISFNFSYHPKESGAGRVEDGYEKDVFLATVNLSVRDYAGFERWCEENEIDNKYVKRYKMYGRHDISIINSQATPDWLMFVLNQLYKEKYKELFWTFEIYVKVEQDTIRDVKPNEERTFRVYDKVREELDSKISPLWEAVEHSALVDKSGFLLPIYEVRDCICSILKNTFAEEFIYCMYESFRHFIVYMTEEIGRMEEDGGIKEENIAESYDSYFTALNTLVNSTMHGERQFIQATAFNAIFYTVPPKIMAFYNAYIYRMKQILEDTGCREQFTYLIYPSFSPIMSVRKISLKENPPCDRIITVRINERTLYDVAVVTYQMVHELAHYSGNRVRCREIRQEKMMRSLLKIVLRQCEIRDGKTIRLLEKYTDECWVMDGRGNFMENFRRNGEWFLRALKEDADGEMEERFEQCYGADGGKGDDTCDEMLYKLGIEGNASQKCYRELFTGQYCHQKYDDFRSMMQAVNDRNTLKALDDFMLLLEKVYRECYADLQMILVLAVNPEDYLDMFIVKQGVPLENLFSEPEDIIRVSIIFKVLMDCGIWEKNTFRDKRLQSVMEGVYRDLGNDFGYMDGEEKERNAAILARMEPYILEYKKDAGDSIRSGGRMAGNRAGFGDGTADAEKAGDGIGLGYFTSVTYGLYGYLLNVTEAALAEYLREEKKGKIREAREIIRTILDFKDTMGVYDCIENEIYSYKDILLPESMH